MSKPKKLAAETQRVKSTLLKRLAEVFGEESLPYLTPDDYPEVREKLGWAPSSYRTALAYLGIDTGDLPMGVRYYTPSDEELEILKLRVSESMITTMQFTGCRFGELWKMRLNGDVLVVYSSKKGRPVILNLGDMTTDNKRLIKKWVSQESAQLGYDAARKRWQRLAASGVISRDCVPHSVRHRAGTLMADAYGIEDAADLLGHRNITTTKGYVHKKLGGRAEKALATRVTV